MRGVTWLSVNAASSRVTWVLLLLFMRGTWVSVTTGEQSFLDFSLNSGFQLRVVSHLVFFTAGEQSYLAGFQLLVMSRVTLFFYCW